MAEGKGSSTWPKYCGESATILCSISSRLVTLRKVIDNLIHFSKVFYLSIIFNFINFSSQIVLLLVPEMSNTLHCLDYL